MSSTGTGRQQLPYLASGRAVLQNTHTFIIIFIQVRGRDGTMSPKKVLMGKKGQAIVETALILPIIILILMGIIDFGLMFNRYLVINNAAREGARNAAVGVSDYEVKNLVSSMTSTLDSSKVYTIIYPAEALRKKGEEVAVTIEYDNKLITPVISAIIPNPLRLKVKTVMRVE
jgi:hypothetical protein